MNNVLVMVKILIKIIKLKKEHFLLNKKCLFFFEKLKNIKKKLNKIISKFKKS